MGKKKKGWIGSIWDDYGFGNWRSKRSNHWTFEERKEMVTPYLNFFDGDRIQQDVRNRITGEIRGTYGSRNTDIRDIANMSINSEAPVTKFESQDALDYVVRDIVSKDLINDIYNLFYHKSGDQEYCIIDETNSGKWKLLQAVNDSGIKIMTNGSHINTSIFIDEICMGIVKSLLSNLDKQQMKKMAQCMKGAKAEKREDREEDDNDGMDGESSSGGDKEGQDSQNSSGAEGKEGRPNEGAGNSGGENSQDDNASEGKPSNPQSENSNGGSSAGKTTGKPTQTDFENLVEKLQNSSHNSLEKTLSEAKQKAFSKIHDLEKNGINLKDFEQKYGSGAAKNIGRLDNIRKELNEINIKEANLRKVVEKVLDNSISYFSTKSKSYELSIFEADEFDDIDGLENLHPILRRFNIEDVVVREKKYYGKLNIYIDVSSSMNDTVAVGGTRMKAMTFAKSIALKMYKMGIVVRIIPFGNDLKAPIDPPNEIEIMLLHGHCGTTIDNVIVDCQRRMENGLVITDAQDSIYQGNSYCWMLCTPGASLQARTDEAREMLERGQIWGFNSRGDDVYRMTS